MVPGRPPVKNGLEYPAILDAMAHDPASDKLILAMYERRPWPGEEAQLIQLQEKLNAYLSFLLDGEMREAFPKFADKAVEIQLRTVHEPDDRAAMLLSRIREQLAFQKIEFVVVLTEEAEFSSASCGH